MATQLLAGKPWSMGTRNCRQPDQWPTSSIMQIRLKMRMKTLAMLRNWKKAEKGRGLVEQGHYHVTLPSARWWPPNSRGGSPGAWAPGTGGSPTSGPPATSCRSGWRCAWTRRLSWVTAQQVQVTRGGDRFRASFFWQIILFLWNNSKWAENMQKRGQNLVMFSKQGAFFLVHETGRIFLFFTTLLWPFCNHMWDPCNVLSDSRFILKNIGLFMWIHVISVMMYF